MFKKIYIIAVTILLTSCFSDYEGVEIYKPTFYKKNIPYFDICFTNYKKLGYGDSFDFDIVLKNGKSISHGYTPFNNFDKKGPCVKVRYNTFGHKGNYNELKKITDNIYSGNIKSMTVRLYDGKYWNDKATKIDQKTFTRL